MTKKFVKSSIFPKKFPSFILGVTICGDKKFLNTKLLFCQKFKCFDKKFAYLTKSPFFAEISIISQNLAFWKKTLILAKISILWEKSHFFFRKIQFFNKKCRFLKKTPIFCLKFQSFGKNFHILTKNFQF